MISLIFFYMYVYFYCESKLNTFLSVSFIGLFHGDWITVVHLDLAWHKKASAGIRSIIFKRLLCLI